MFLIMAALEVNSETKSGINNVVQQFEAAENVFSYGCDIFNCGVCSESFKNLSSFLNHKIKHAAQGQPVECSLCGRSYNKKCFLREHYKKKHRLEFIEGNEIVRVNRKQILQTPQTVEEETKAMVSTLNEEGVILESSDDPKVTENTDLNTIHVVITKTNDEINNVIDVINPSSTTAGSAAIATQQLQQHVNDIPVENAESVKNEPEHEISVEEFSKQVLNVQSTVPKSLDVDTSITSDQPDFHFIFLNSSKQGKKFSYDKHGFKCLHCDFKTSWRMSLCKHMSQNHTDIMEIHKYIEIKSPELDSNQKLMRMSEYLVDLHESKDKKKKKYRGVEMQDRPGVFNCVKCEKVFNRLRYLRKHMDIHKTERKYLCDECGKAFKTKNYLQAHRRTHKIKTFKCSQCSFTSSVNGLIHAHRQLHPHGSVLCDVCGQAYLDNSTLKKHKRVHDMSRPFGCTFPGCTWRFNKETLCQAHVKSHTTTGQFVCSICEYSFRHKHHLQRHLHKLHGIQPPKNKTKKEECLINDKEHEEDSTVNFVIDSDQLESVIQQGNLVISSTDVEGNTVNYVTYHTLLDQETIPTESDAQTIVIPQSECSQIIFQP